MEHSKTLAISLLLSCAALLSYPAVITPSDKTTQQEILGEMQHDVSRMRTKYDVLSEISRIRTQFDDITDTAISVVDRPGSITPLSLLDFAIIYNYMFYCRYEDRTEAFYLYLWRKLNSDLVRDIYRYCSILGDNETKSMFGKIIYDMISIECGDFVDWLLANRNKTVRYSEATDTLKRLIPNDLYEVFTNSLLSSELRKAIEENSLEFNIRFID